MGKPVTKIGKFSPKTGLSYIATVFVRLISVANPVPDPDSDLNKFSA
jgi:hypothetical protein